MSDNIITCQVRGETILLHLDSGEQVEGQRNYELWRAETFATKEPDTLDWIDTCIGPGQVIYDVGANIGQYSLYAACRLKRDCRVFAFEPEALNFAKLNRNIVLNGLSDTISAYCLAVADSTELGRFYIQRFAPGASLHSWATPVTQGERAFESEHQQGILAVSLDDLTGHFGLDFPNHIKIDVDGIEQQIVAGAGRTLLNSRLRSVLIEVYMHNDTAQRIHEQFEAAGFVLSNAECISYQPGIVQNLIYTRAPQ